MKAASAPRRGRRLQNPLSLRTLLAAMCVISTFLFLAFETIKACLIYMNTMIENRDDYVSNSRTYMFVNIMSSACLGFVILVLVGLIITPAATEYTIE